MPNTTIQQPPETKVAGFSEAEVKKLLADESARLKAEFNAELAKRTAIANFNEALIAGVDGKALPVAAIKQIAGFNELVTHLAATGAVTFADGKPGSLVSVLTEVIKQSAKSGTVNLSEAVPHSEKPAAMPTDFNGIHNALAQKQHAENLKLNPQATFSEALEQTYTLADQIHSKKGQVQ